jgi:hypothetical protein
MQAKTTPIMGQPSAHGHAVECVWCGYVSHRSQHIWTDWEDVRGWECENESACRVRLDIANEA